MKKPTLCHDPEVAPHHELLASYKDNLAFWRSVAQDVGHAVTASHVLLDKGVPFMMIVALLVEDAQDHGYTVEEIAKGLRRLLDHWRYGEWQQTQIDELMDRNVELENMLLDAKGVKSGDHY